MRRGGGERTSTMRYAAEEVFVMFIPKKLKKAIETELEKATMSTLGTCCTCWNASYEFSIGRPPSMMCCSPNNAQTSSKRPHNPSFPTATSAGKL